MKENVREYRGYNIVPEGTFPTLVVKAKGQGMVPKALSGSFTNTYNVEKAIDGYLNSLRTKGKKNGSTKDSVTS
jgi:hypothetical protein